MTDTNRPIGLKAGSSNEPSPGCRRNRRLSKDYERKVQTSETLIELAMIRLLVVRIGQHL